MNSLTTVGVQGTRKGEALPAYAVMVPQPGVLTKMIARGSPRKSKGYSYD